MKNRTFSSMPTFGELERIKELKFDGTIEKSDREQAIEWWNNLTKLKREDLYMYYFGCKACDLFPDEIERIWIKETQQKSLIELQADKVEKIAFKNLKKEEIPQVDFELLKSTIKKLEDPIREDMINLQLFFELLSKSSTFAHKAHKNLKQLNKK